jgi:carbamoyltransferase
VGAFLASGFSEAAVLVSDGEGNDGDTESVYVGSRTNGLARITRSRPGRPSCKGIGRTYEAFANLYGWTDADACKVMALAAYCSPDGWPNPSTSLLSVTGLEVESALRAKHADGAMEYLANAGLWNPAWHGRPLDAVETIVPAAVVQMETQRALLQLIKNIRSQTGLVFLCFSGGVALNCVANAGLREVVGAQRFFVFPPASDCGQALGNALYGAWKLAGNAPSIAPYVDFLGRTYDEQETKDALELMPSAGVEKQTHCVRLAYEKVDDPAVFAAEQISAGKIVGWFQGGSELGPRGLGHRSILAHPGMPPVAARLRAVKGREHFSPFAPSVVSESIDTYFEMAHGLSFMTVAVPLRVAWRDALSGVVHVDGTARVHVVEKAVNPEFHRLLDEVGRRTGHPIVINTSFNRRGEPIVETPGDAIGCFLNSDLDAVVIDRFVARKT